MNIKEIKNFNNSIYDKIYTVIKINNKNNNLIPYYYEIKSIKSKDIQLNNDNKSFKLNNENYDYINTYSKEDEALIHANLLNTHLLIEKSKTINSIDEFNQFKDLVNKMNINIHSFNSFLPFLYANLI